MALADFRSLVVCSLLVLFIVAMVRVELELSERVRGTRATKRRDLPDFPTSQSRV